MEPGLPLGQKLRPVTGGKLPKLGAPEVLAAAIVLFGLVAMAGWVLREPALVRLADGFGTVDFNTAFCLALLAASLVLFRREAPTAQLVAVALSGIVTALSLAVLVEHLLELDIGVDWAPLHAWLQKSAAYPGRMAPGTAAALLSYGIAGLLWPYAGRRPYGTTLQLLTLLGIVIGALGAIAKLLHIGFVYNRTLFAAMGLATALGIVLVGVALIIAGPKAGRHALFAFRGEDEKITAVGTGILVAVAGTAVALGFLLVSRSVEQQLHDSEHAAIQNRAALYRTNIENHVTRAGIIAADPALARQLGAVQKNPQDRIALALLQHTAHSWLPHGFSGVAFYSDLEQQLAYAGRLRDFPETMVRLSAPQPIFLGWDNGFFLHARLAVFERDKRVGSVIAEQFLPVISGTLHDMSAASETGEIVVCGMDGMLARCFPSRFSRRPFQYPHQDAKGSYAIYRALNGETGVADGLDYRGQRVTSAYSPIGAVGLAVEKKIDRAELNEPVRQQLERTLPAVALVVVAGMLLLRVRVRPLAAKLALNEERLRLALDASQLTTWDGDTREDRVYLSPQWQVMLGGTPHPTTTTFNGLWELIHTQDQQRFRDHLRDVLKGTVPHYDIEIRVRTLTGEWKWIRSRGEVVERDHTGWALRLIGTIGDISERKETEARLAYQATHDALTTLPNRSLFYDRLEQAVARSRRGGSLMAVLYLDIDNFKDINDTRGHAVGDALLGAVGRRLAGWVRSTDTVARLGGDEFALVLEGLGAREDGCHIAEKIISGMQPEFSVGARSLSVTTSIGVAFYDGASEIDPDALLRRADESLYAAKAAGRNNYQVAG